MEFKSNQRVFICGKTGSGKSFFVKHVILPRVDTWLFYDPKHEHTLQGAQVVHSIEEVATALKDKVKKIHYKPLEDDDWTFNEMCRHVWHHGNRALFLDEINTHVTPMQLPKYCGWLYRMGRTRNIAVIGCSQRPAGCHNTAISEAEHMIAFQLQLETDRKKLEDTVGEPAKSLNDLEKFQFLYYNSETGKAIIGNPINV